MKGFILRAVTFLAAVFSSSKASSNTRVTQELKYSGKSSAGAITRMGHNMPFYCGLRYKRGKKGKVMAWS